MKNTTIAPSNTPVQTPQVPIRCMNAFVNFVERMIESHPLPWRAGIVREKPESVPEYGIFSGKTLVVISPDYERAVTTSRWINEEYAEA